MIYYELKHNYKDYKKGYYVVDNLVTDTSVSPYYYLMAISHRVWNETSFDVTFRKNRDNASSVDMEEFFWIKLQAKQI